mmetsp:Transcript_39323/g.111498  ORF Transcript_39323/g.111498 Transcript_39323/m.111498 type:complete len:223 (-) Transcript_39323:384-1052(-)
MLRWSTQHLSIQTLGSRPLALTKAPRQRCSASHFASGSSCHEWETKASQRCSGQSCVLLRRPGRGELSAMSWNSRLSKCRQRNLAAACASTSRGRQFPTSAATPAAAWRELRASRETVSARRSFRCHVGRAMKTRVASCTGTHIHFTDSLRFLCDSTVARQTITTVQMLTQAPSRRHIWMRIRGTSVPHPIQRAHSAKVVSMVARTTTTVCMPMKDTGKKKR